MGRSARTGLRTAWAADDPSRALDNQCELTSLLERIPEGIIKER